MTTPSNVPDPTAHPAGEAPAPSAEWLTPPGPASAEPAPARPWKRWAAAGGLVVAGLAAGVGIGVAVNHDGGGTRSAAAGAPGYGGQAGAGVPNGGPGGRGGFDGDGQDGRGDGPGGGQAGEQHVTGTITAVGSSSVTVKSSAGTATYTITGATRIVRNGVAATVAQLKAGDPVLVHVLSGGTAERIFAGAQPGGPDR